MKIKYFVLLIMISFGYQVHGAIFEETLTRVAHYVKGAGSAFKQINEVARCLVPGCDDLSYSELPSKEELWDRYHTL